MLRSQIFRKQGKMKHFKTFMLIALATSIFQPLKAQSSSGLKVEAVMQYTGYVLGETIPIGVTVANSGTSVFIVDDYPPYTENGLVIQVRNSKGNLLPTKTDKPFIDAISVKSGEKQTVVVRIEEFYDMTVPGRYLISAVVNRGSAVSTSNLFSISVVSGFEISSTSRIKAGFDDVSLNYTLLYWPRKEREHLFIRVTEDPPGSITGFAHLGNVVRITQPTIEFPGGNAVVVTHQTSRDHFTRTTVDFSRDRPIEKKEEMVNAHALREEIVMRHVSNQMQDLPEEPSKKKERGFFSRRTRRVTDEK